MTPKPYPGWLSMEPDRANLELRPDAPPPEPRRVRTVRVEAESIGAGLLRVREAHRYCTNKAHGGHDFEDCPVLAEFRRLVR